MATLFRQVSDNAVTTTATSLASTGVTSITVATGKGALFPTPGNGFRLDIWSGTSTDPTTDANYEQVICTARSGDVLTISATTKTHTGSPINVMLPQDAADITDLQTAVNAIESAPYLTPSSTNTVSNKTLANTKFQRTSVSDANYTLNATTDFYVCITSITAPRTFTLPSTAGIGQQTFIIKDESGSVNSTNTLTIATTSSQTIDGRTSIVLNKPYDTLQVECDGTNWKLIEIPQSLTAGSSFVPNENPGGSVNGSNTTFTTASQFASGSLVVRRNGVTLTNGVDFTENGTTNGFSMTTAPNTGDTLRVQYNVWSSVFSVGTNSQIKGEIPTGTINGSNTVFTTARAYIAGSTAVFVDGIRQRLTTDYTETTPSSGTLTFVSAPQANQGVTVDYDFNLNPSSNADTVDGIHASSTATANQLMPLDGNAKVGSALLSNPYKFYVYRNAALTSSTTATVIAFDSKTAPGFDTGSNVDITTNKGRFTAPIAGFYYFTARAGLTAALNTEILISLYVNGSAAIKGLSVDPSQVSVENSVIVSGLLSLNANDYVEAYFIGGGGSTMAVGSAVCYFQGFLVSTL